MSESLLDAAASVQRRLADLLAAPVLSVEPAPLETVRTAVDVHGRAGALVVAAVRHARERGASWQDIGDILGITRQAAFQRYGRPVDPRTGEAMNTTPLPEAESLARHVVDDLAAGNWEAVVARFDARMRVELDAEGLGAAWAQIIGLAGAYENMGETTVARAADFTVTNTLLNFEAGEFVARVAVRDDQTVAGLFLLPPGTP